ncbi:hypothetical protein IV487_13370 [Enterococcus saccharolyticus]|uniref:hypothetical protein n=1 Tax=Enterococcus TaxID=1350 RepID=UPI003AF0F184|nr:hypothetical protein [Enterococcus saccharolyticus]
MLERLEEINSLFVLIFGSGISIFLQLILKQINKRNNVRKEEEGNVTARLEKLEFASLAMLHNNIYEQCEEYLTNGYISIDELDDLDYLFRAYKGLGGNGAGETLYHKVRALPNHERKGKNTENE